MCKGVSMAGGAPFVCLRAGWRCACPYPTTPPGPQGRHHYKQTGVTDITLTASHLIVERRTTTPWRPALQIYTMHYMPLHAPICPCNPSIHLSPGVYPRIVLLCFVGTNSPTGQRIMAQRLKFSYGRANLGSPVCTL